jgi:hypothetical protein
VISECWEFCSGACEAGCVFVNKLNRNMSHTVLGLLD